MAGGVLLGLGVGVILPMILLRSRQPKPDVINTALVPLQPVPIEPSPSVPPYTLGQSSPIANMAPSNVGSGPTPPSALPPGPTAESDPNAANIQASSLSPVTRPAPTGPVTMPVAGIESFKPATPIEATPPVTVPATLPSGRPLPEPLIISPDTLTDARIGQSITDGVNFLLSRVDNSTHELRESRGSPPPAGGKPDPSALFGGRDALCVYALLQSGQAISDSRLGIKSPLMIGLIDQLKKLPDQTGPVTYARALRCTALALYHRQEDNAAIRLDFEWLLKAAKDGAYTYDIPDLSQEAADPKAARKRGRWDNSNSQYGLLGVWSAAEAGFAVPMTYWKEVEEHWTTNQMRNGQWGYVRPEYRDGRLSMTSAGIASLFVTHDWLVAPKFGNDVGRDPYSPALLKGLKWFEASDHSVDLSDSWQAGYTYYGIERVGLASGFKYFGSHDWYRELARQILAAQNPDGSWGPQPLVDTAYSLLFLARGRHPILMNKLRFDGFWANRPRDLANLSKYVSEQIEQPVNWQVVPISHDWTDWTDCPILYLASHEAPVLADRDYDNIRSFIQSGGLLFTQADGGDPKFNNFVRQMSSKLFPAYEMADLPLNHPLYSVLFRMSAKPRLQVVSNGARLLIVHSPNDLARAWQLRQDQLQKTPFEFGLNLFEYASGKHDLRNRLETNIIPARRGTPSCMVSVARLRYAGNWDPEPYAWTRFSRWFQTQTGYGIDLKTVDMSQLTPQTKSIAILTGTAAYSPKPEEATAIKKYVEAGGVLFVDLAGGAGVFEEFMRTKLFAEAFPNGFLMTLPSDHPLLNAGLPGMSDLTHPRLRAYALEQLGTAKNEFPSFFNAGRGHVIFTPHDITCGLLGTYTWGIVGYDPEYCENLMKNLLIWAVDGQKDE
jgi:hypothetical protein